MGATQTEQREDEEIVEEVVHLSPTSLALSAVDRAAIDAQVATAKQYPRTLSSCIKEATSLATLDEETAASMFYSLPRGKKPIEGPSARLAEVMMYAWGNFRADADVVGEDRTHITAMGTAFDLEKNLAVRVRVKRRITDKHGKRYNDDMIGVTANAAISIALRNCVFKVIPRAIVDRIYIAARKASVGDIKTLSAKRADAIAWFNKAGVTSEQIFEKLDVQGIDDIGEAEYLTLRGLYNAVKDGEISLDSAFGKESATTDGTNSLNADLERKASGATTPAPAATPKKGEAKAAPAAKAGTGKCDVCFRTDGSHDPNAPCGKKIVEADLAEDAEIAREQEQRERGGKK